MSAVESSLRGPVREEKLPSLVCCTLCLALGLLSVLFLIDLTGKHAAAALSGGKTIIIEADAGPVKYNGDHAPQMSSPVPSQLHRDVVGALRTAQTYKESAELLDNMTEPVIRQGITRSEWWSFVQFPEDEGQGNGYGGRCKYPCNHPYNAFLDPPTVQSGN